MTAQQQSPDEPEKAISCFQVLREPTTHLKQARKPDGFISWECRGWRKPQGPVLRKRWGTRAEHRPGCATNMDGKKVAAGGDITLIAGAHRIGTQWRCLLRGNRNR